MQQREGAEQSLWQTVAGGLLALAVAMGIGRFAFTPILPTMHDELAVPTVTLGVLASSNYLGYLVGAIAVSALTNPRMLATVLRWSLVTVIVVTGLMAATTLVPVWLGLRFVAGVASAGVFVTAAAIVLHRVSREGRPELGGWFFGGVGTGIALSGAVVLLTGQLAAGSGEVWRWSWLAITGLALLLAGPGLLWPRPAFAPARPSRAGAPVTPAITRTRWAPLLLLALAYFLEGVGYIVAGTFLVAIVAATEDQAPAATVAWIVVGLAAAPSAVAWAWAAKRLTPAAALSLAYVAQAVGLVLTGPGGAWMPAAILFGGTFVGITSLTITIGRDLTEPRLATRAIAALTAVFGLGQIIGPLLATALAGDQAGLARVMPVAAGLVFLGAILVAAVHWMSRTAAG